ncbi:CLUMA_CG010550, isoform A [Clunio marinus]|uniref:CLUMA_CG010550, isoform A n=1 Tax=Clunio marinus TaxID=568069 RepID=A0A1J1IFC3_9DIPT|nr:CLUMA_CG010550, isoform A [Clunio marinus]
MHWYLISNSRDEKLLMNEVLSIVAIISKQSDGQIIIKFVHWFKLHIKGKLNYEKYLATYLLNQ